MTESKTSRRKPPWRKGWRHYAKIALIWVGSAVIAATVAGTAVDWLKPKLGAALDEATEVGDAVLTTPEPKDASGNVWLPPDVQLAGAELDDLTSLSDNDQPARLEEYGGIIFGELGMNLTLEGNRSDTVRITDIRPVSECQEVDEGTLVITTEPKGGIAMTSAMTINVQDPSIPPTWFDAEAAGRGGTYPEIVNFFDTRTITLEKGEEIVIYVELHAKDKLCSVDLEMTVVDDGQKLTQRVLGEGNELRVAPRDYMEVISKFTVLYIGTGYCHEYVRAPVERAHAINSGLCGPGNGIYGAEPTE